MSGVNIPGTVVSAKITTGNTANTFATMDVNDAQGGFMQVGLLIERDNISQERRKIGMRVYVTETDKDYKLGTDLVTWTDVTSGGGTTQTSFYYDIASCAIGNPTQAGASVELMRFVATRNFKFDVDLPNSVARAEIGPSQDLIFPLLYNARQFGTMVFKASTGIIYATFQGQAQSFNPRDVLAVMSPTVADPQIKDVEWNLAAILG